MEFENIQVSHTFDFEKLLTIYTQKTQKFADLQTTLNEISQPYPYLVILQTMEDNDRNQLFSIESHDNITV